MAVDSIQATDVVLIPQTDSGGTMAKARNGQAVGIEGEGETEKAAEGKAEGPSERDVLGAA